MTKLGEESSSVEAINAIWIISLPDCGQMVAYISFGAKDM
jgi:hypothetical protein